MFEDWYAKQQSHPIIHQEFNHTVYGCNTDNAREIALLSQFAVNLLTRLRLDQYTTSQPHFYSYILPDYEFLSATNIPPNFAEWATVCVRASKDNKGYEDMVVWSEKHHKKIPNLGGKNLSEDDADVIRESIHENAHLIMDHYSGFPTSESTPFSEALVEYIPRVRFGLQKYMPESTNFLAELPNEKILTARSMWDGLSQHSSDPLSKNFAYASCFLLGVGIINRIMDVCKCDMDAALSKYIAAFKEAEISDLVVNNLAKLINVDQLELWDSKKLLLDGQKWLKEHTRHMNYDLLARESGTQSKDLGMTESSV